jgi:pimeloyl-ACP methyl ester carboxylesterase
VNTRDAPRALEVLSHAPARLTHKTPLLFVHGAFTGAWCWQEHFLPFFAKAGYAAHALSLSGHGASRGRERLDTLSIADYVDDVREVVAQLPTPPVLIGHSMGGFVVQKYLERYAAPAAVLMCSVPPQGMMGVAINAMLTRPALLSNLNDMMAGGNASYESLREAMFAQDITLADLTRFYRLSQPESHRAIWDMTLFNQPDASSIVANLTSSEAGKTSRPLSRKGGWGDSPTGAEPHLLVLGAEHDHLMPAATAEMTARAYGVSAEIFPGMGHGLMLERDWRVVAERISAWITEHGL